MASIFCSLPPSHSLLPSRSKAIAGQSGSRSIKSENADHLHSKIRVCSDEGCAPKRRDLLLRIFISSFALPVIASNAVAETDVQGNFRAYEDETNKFRILVPQGWLVGAADTKSIYSVTAFFPEEASDSNVSIAITGLGPDFTSLKSFGSVDAFAESLVSGLDRSWTRPPGLAAKLIDCKAANGLYYVEYTMQSPGEKLRHLYSAIGAATNGWYNRLYTVTGQFVEDESDKYGSEIQKAVSSFRLT
ncbi:psbP domain-containing protein 3, chloroplastic [Asparagus officinalis]|uniref:psbP domain-containing protein 3, chloroplastic n=1 Tax=Asparagus officinalis TaxID=4686 RepID=UPI00098E059A|nr:psbP domain-containing protein 3, chloroplastic [Asparagus officinalis]